MINDTPPAIGDTPPADAAPYVILVEEVIPFGADDHHWQLMDAVPVDGDRAAAEDRARTLALEHVPMDVHVRHGATPARNVYRTPDGSWLLEVTVPTALAPALARITVAEHVHAQEYVPPPEPSSTRKGRLFRRG
ncbi:hypothetical protein [Streptomyces mangrovisoli]|uniref:Uncharacterized protein n=1 Tax=Streptomyces mangrovisoli TaxID=1428628 RepID=A0A1J4P382_9ACTN|nr:hypothetical protein [Streptomyces mangrovisoli]OIJ68674.1 hypothetical protein WN71_006465 [Streptomyces mangrovisoli]